jgi:hypothetical protein
MVLVGEKSKHICIVFAVTEVAVVLTANENVVAGFQNLFISFVLK